MFFLMKIKEMAFDTEGGVEMSEMFVFHRKQSLTLSLSHSNDPIAQIFLVKCQYYYPLFQNLL